MGHFRNAQGEEAGEITHPDLTEAGAARERVTLDLKCPYCGHPGQITWEENVMSRRHLGPQRRLIAVTPGFHVEPGRSQSGDPLIVCSGCDSIQPD